MQRKIQIVVGAVLSLGLLGLVLRTVELEATAQVIKTARYAYLLPGLLTLLLTFLVKVFRWQALLKPVARVPARSLLPAVMIGFFSNRILPANTGELVRAFVLGQENQVGGSATLGTIVVERLLDVFVLTVLMAVALVIWPMPGWIDTLALFVAVAVVGGWFVLWLALWQKSRADRLLRLVVGRFSLPLAHRIGKLLDRFLLGLETLRSIEIVAGATGLTIALWGLSVLTFFFIGR
ncbi:MAG: lysylphosphatidylglycerol synthase transmembrane domain-containing protein, partial [Anaerolineae bacterium]